MWHFSRIMLIFISLENGRRTRQFNSYFLLWQPYIADMGLDKMHKGLEHSGIPGIPTQAEYLAEYCSLSVSAITLTLMCHI